MAGSGSELPLEVTIEELADFADAALRSQPGCANARVLELRPLQNVVHGRNWEIPKVALGDSLISDVDRAVLSVHRQLGRKYRLVTGR